MEIMRVKQDSGDLTVIPAVYKHDRTLELRQNGISPKFFNDFDFDRYDKSEFELFAEEPFLKKEGEWWAVPYYMYHGEPWYLFFVIQNKGNKKGNLLYSVLRRCKKDTILCTCQDCGKKYVLSPKIVQFYESKDLKPPTTRCPACIELKKIQKR